MKLGMSSYCLTPAMQEGRKTVFDVIDFAVANKCEHIEFVPFFLPFVNEETKINHSLIKAVRDKCKDSEIEISTYSVNADLLKSDKAELETEIERVKRHIDVAFELGLTRMRFDVASFRRPFETNTVLHFDNELPRMVEVSRLLCDYANEKSINIVMENHGFFINGSERVLRLIEATQRDNLKMTVDIGNFLCVDEESVIGLKKCLPYAQMIHLKDFYVREKSKLPGQTEMFNCNMGSWFETLGGKMLRGSILGQGDIDIHAVLKTIKDFGFDGYVSVEFEGMENCEQGTEISLAMAKAIWEAV